MKFFTIIFYILIWICTLCSIDISVTFSDGTKLICKGWLRKLIKENKQ